MGISNNRQISVTYVYYVKSRKLKMDTQRRDCPIHISKKNVNIHREDYELIIINVSVYK